VGPSLSQPKSTSWWLLYRIAGVSALLMVAMSLLQVFVFIVAPPPETVLEAFATFERSAGLGLLSLDLSYLAVNALVLVLFPAVCITLKEVNRSIALIAGVFGITGAISFFNSNVAFGMLTLFRRYTASVTAEAASAYLAAGESMMAVCSGTAFHMHYVLGSVAMLLISVLMLRSPYYGKAVAVIGIVTNVVAFGFYVPGIGVYVSSASALGYVVWLVIVGITLLRTQQHDDE
jgi:hypothetical protein